MSLEESTNNIIREHWKPNPKQAAFLSVPWTIKEAGYLGGAGSGKSDVLLMYGIVHKLHQNPLFKQVFMRRTFPELKKEIVPRSQDIYRRFGATFNSTDMVWTFPREDQYGSGMRNDGARIFLSHCQNETDVHTFDSMEISLFSPDEITSLTEFIYLYIAFERNRAPKNSGLPSITRTAGMPGGIGHTFVKKRFIDPCPEGGKVIIGKGNNKRIFIHATLADNPHIDPTYSQSLDGRPEAERKAKKFGDWNAYLGQVFDEFRDKHYTDEPDNALHVIEPFDIPSWWPRFVIGDWGFTAMTYIGFYAVSPSKRLYQYRELAFLKTKIADWGMVVKEFIDKEQPKVVKFCKSAGQDRGQEHTIQQQIEEILGRPIELSSHNAGSRIAGKMLIHEYLRWKPLPAIAQKDLPAYNEEHASWLLRNKGLEDYKAYLSIFDPPKVEDNLPKFQLFNTCTVKIDAIKACSYDKPRNNKPAEDIAEFDGDDPIDEFRYAVDTADKYFNESVHEFEKVQSQQRIIDLLKQNQDMTAFYRNMASIENNKRINMVKTFHRGRRH